MHPYVNIKHSYLFAFSGIVIVIPYFKSKTPLHFVELLFILYQDPCVIYGLRTL